MTGGTRPERTRPDDETLVAGKIGPAIVIPVHLRLAMPAGEQRVTQLIGDATRCKADEIRPAECRPVEQELEHRLFLGTARDEVDHATERRSSIERGCDALDDLDAAEIHRRDLQQSEP